MAAINDLIAQIENAELRERIAREVERMSKQKKYGLVFEEHLPECTPLYDIPVKAGSHAALKNGNMNNIYSVIAVSDDKALCFHEADNTQCELPLADLVCAAQFGEAIYPYLKPLDSVCSAPDSDLWHTLIEADNYHALQLLEYLYGGKVDCIYIDPPYNTGAKDWKYNNDYVDSADIYRHSKWLSMMKKRLELAKKLLNPEDSVLIITIDEKEYLRLGCLLEELFPEARMQMISTVINPTGNNHVNEFSRTNEYIYVLMFGNCLIEKVLSTQTISKGSEVHWEPLKRSDLASRRGTTKGGVMQFYPIYIDKVSGKIAHVGDYLTPDEDINNVPTIEGTVPVFPIRDNGTEMNWGLIREELTKRLEKGYVRVGKYAPNKPQKYSISYLTTGVISDIESGKAEVQSCASDGSVKAYYIEDKKSFPTTQWSISSHDAKNYGTGIIRSLLPNRNFSFPKSLYAVEYVLRIFVANKPNALIVDFFAGSGTTLHAVNLLNAEDGGHRRCIMVTNNEVSADEAKALTAQGYQPGDDEWEKLGIARYVTWPRTVCSIEGHDVNGQPLKGTYLGSDIPMSEGFRANAAFFKLGFLDKTEVKLGRQFKELLPVIWLKAGAVGRCPALEGDTLPDMLILPENKFAVLLQEDAFGSFEQKMKEFPLIQTVFLVTDYEPAYVSMSKRLNVQTSYQLYRDYLDNFRINIRRERA